MCPECAAEMKRRQEDYSTRVPFGGGADSRRRGISTADAEEKGLLRWTGRGFVPPSSDASPAGMPEQADTARSADLTEKVVDVDDGQLSHVPVAPRRGSGVSRGVLALLLAFALSLCGFGISLLVDSSTPLWGLLGLSLVVCAWRIVRRRKWRFPSIPSLLLLVLCTGAVLAFAGVQPLADYKDAAIAKWDSFYQGTIVAEWGKSQTERTAEQTSQTVGDTRAAVEQKGEAVERRVVAVDIGVGAPGTGITDYADMLNNYRLSHGLAPLVFTDDLNRIAELRLGEIQKDYGHSSAGGYNHHLSENINMVSFGPLSNNIAFASWKSSPGHNANMLDPRNRYTGYAIGGGCAVQVFSEYPTVNGEPQLPPGWYWDD